MNLFLTILALLCIALLPALIIWLTRKNKVLGAIGAIVCCYLVGFAFSTIGFSGVDYDKGLQRRSHTSLWHSPSPSFSSPSICAPSKN